MRGCEKTSIPLEKGKGREIRSEIVEAQEINTMRGLSLSSFSLRLFG